MSESVTCRQVIETELKSTGLSAVDLLAGLLHVLGRHHVETIGLHRIGTFSDGLDSVTGKKAVSLAESVLNFATEEATNLKQLASCRMQSGGEESAALYTQIAHQLDGLVELLKRVCAEWNREAENLRAKGYKHPENVIR